MVKKAVLKGSLFFIILILIISCINPIFINKVGHRNKIIQGLYENTGDSYDVVLVGSSHMNGAINPNLLWDQYGITSFNYGTGGQPVDVSYYLLKEILKNHNNPIVVLDLYYLGLTEPYGQEGYIRYVLDSMKFSFNKIDAIIHCTPRKDWIYYLVPFFKYHSRWKELKKEDFLPEADQNSYTKGFGAGRLIYDKDNMSDLSITETAELPSKTEEYLYKIIDLSKKEGFKLIFINSPHDYTSTEGFTNWHEEPAKMFNRVAEIAKDKDIPFINYCNKLDEIGFDFKSDMNNSGHVNVWGSNKLTLDLGRFLKENYPLVDHRGDERYAQWDLDAEYYFKMESNKSD